MSDAVNDQGRVAMIQSFRVRSFIIYNVSCLFLFPTLSFRGAKLQHFCRFCRHWRRNKIFRRRERTSSPRRTKFPAAWSKTFSVAWKYISKPWKYILVVRKYISKPLKKFCAAGRRILYRRAKQLPAKDSGIVRRRQQRPARQAGTRRLCRRENPRSRGITLRNALFKLH